jgi:hypothetical protein
MIAVVIAVAHHSRPHLKHAHAPSKRRLAGQVRLLAERFDADATTRHPRSRA